MPETVPATPQPAARRQPCPDCGAAVAADQRYCLACGARCADPSPEVVRWLRAAGIVAVPTGPRSSGRRLRVPAAMAAAGVALCAGTLLGVAAGPAPPASLAAGRAPQLIAVLSPPTTTSAAPAAPAREPADAAPAEPTADPEPETPGAGPDAAAAEDAPTAAPAPTDAPATQPESTDASPATPTAAPAAAGPPIKHVWVIGVASAGYDTLFGPDAPPSLLKDTLREQGTLLTRYATLAAAAPANGIALLSGAEPTAATAAGCTVYGGDCLAAPTVQTLPDQLTGAGLTWKAYVEGSGTLAATDPAQPATCRHPEPETPDPWQAPRAGDAFLTPRDPFVYFGSITGDAVCGTNVVGTDRLVPDLKDPEQTPAFSYIVPDACHDGGAVPCAPGAPAGPAAADAALGLIVTAIRATDAYRDGGVIVVAPDSGAPGADGPLSRERAGALVLSPFARAGGSSTHPYDPRSLLRTIEGLFGLDRLAGVEGVRAFGSDVLTSRADARVAREVAHLPSPEVHVSVTSR